MEVEQKKTLKIHTNTHTHTLEFFATHLQCVRRSFCIVANKMPSKMFKKLFEISVKLSKKPNTKRGRERERERMMKRGKYVMPLKQCIAKRVK